MSYNPDSKFVDQIMEQGKWSFAGVKVIKEDKKEEKSEKSEKPVNEGKETDRDKKIEQHVCPLCESVLKEPISEDNMLKHAASMYEVFEAVEQTLNEETEDSEESEDDETEYEDEDSEDESDSDEDEDDEDEE